jgi:hypothetical protein
MKRRKKTLMSMKPSWNCRNISEHWFVWFFEQVWFAFKVLIGFWFGFSLTQIKINQTKPQLTKNQTKPQLTNNQTKPQLTNNQTNLPSPN